VLRFNEAPADAQADADAFRCAASRGGAVEGVEYHLGLVVGKARVHEVTMYQLFLSI
jgi:hypothetical protein